MSQLLRKLLVIGYVWPEPNSSAAGRHMLSLLRLFRSQNWEVHYASPAATGEHQHDLNEEGITSHQITLNCSSFDSFISELSPKAVLFDRFMMEEQFSWRVAKNCPDAIRIIDLEDLHSLRQARHEATKKNKAISAASSDLAIREVAAIFRSDLSLVISDAELKTLTVQYQVPQSLLVHCPFILEPNEELIPSYEQRSHFISIGNFRHAPNWDAVLRLKQEIWPLIRDKLPKAELHIYGAYPPPKATQLHNPKQGFLVKGWAPDAREVMSASRVCLAPLRFGAGLKGKLTEAMLCGTPSITTNIGAEGIQGECPWPGAIENEDYAFARAAVEIYQNSQKWHHAQNCSERILTERFDRSEIEAHLIQRVEHCLENLEEHRRGNFIGTMLQHQTMKATQYMSQWIEAKNSV